jgi:hypothetical protein
LGERLNGIQEVRGSTPLGSTRLLLAIHEISYIGCAGDFVVRAVLYVQAAKTIRKETARNNFAADA